MDDTILNPSMEPPLLFSIDDSVSLLLSENSDNNNFYVFERGSRYGEYARLRESKLRLKREYEKILKEEEDRFFGGDNKPATRFGFTRENEIRVSPEKKTRFGLKYNPASAANPNPRRLSSSSSSSLAQSVPDFSSMTRKENRRPVNSNMLPRRTDLTPPPSKSRNATVLGSASSTRGSMSVGDKKSRGMMGMSRKSYANVEDLKKVTMAAASAIHGGGGGRKSIGGGGRTILGYRQIY